MITIKVTLSKTLFLKAKKYTEINGYSNLQELIIEAVKEKILE